VRVPTSEQELTALFHQLGARSPEQWAHSQITEGIPQLLRFLFLKYAWSRVIAEGDTTWIGRAIKDAEARPDQPYAGLGAALARCRAAGASSEDLTEIARCLQAQMIFAITYIIDGPPYELSPIKDLSWGLFQITADGRPIGPQVSGLYESVLEFDPTGRDMRPENASMTRSRGEA
jgi:hypothetical protein